MTTTTHYQRALRQLEQEGMHRNWKPLLLAHLNAPRHTTTMSRLAKSVGYADHNGANLQYGLLGARLGQMLGFQKQPLDFRLGSLATWKKDQPLDEHFKFTMRRELVEALKRLQWDKCSGRSILVLWRWKEALNCKGKVITRSIGNQMRSVGPGDMLYICATNANELYMLGMIKVKKAGRENDSYLRRQLGGYYAEGEALSGPINIISLGKRQWDLRFVSSNSDRLSKKRQIGFQLQQHRYLTPASTKLLQEILQVPPDNKLVARKQFVIEGRKLTRLVSSRERKIRQQALKHHGTTCQICNFDFNKLYGEFAKECVEVHHLNPISRSASNGSQTSLDEVIVTCPNCHRALHSWIDPANWKTFRKLYHR
ncbi:MAG: HNH endonuclease [Nitrospira sp.]|nr:HNH endonuclease [Nitrospira sp.]